VKAIRAYVSAIQPEDADPRGFRAMCVIAAAVQIGASAADLAVFTGYDVAEVAPLLDRLRAEGVFGPGGPPPDVILERRFLLGCASVAVGDMHYRPGQHPPFALTEQGRRLARLLLGKEHDVRSP
jgi:hypothetical protein